MCMFSHFYYCDCTILHLLMMLLISYLSIIYLPWMVMCFVWLWYTFIQIWYMCCWMFWHIFLSRHCEKTLYCCFLQVVLHHVYYMHLYEYVSKYLWDLGLYWYCGYFYDCLACVLLVQYSIYMFAYVKIDDFVYSTDFCTFHSCTNFSTSC